MRKPYLYWLEKAAIVKQKEINLIKDMLNDFDHDALEVLSFDASDRLKFNGTAKSTALGGGNVLMATPFG